MRCRSYALFPHLNVLDNVAFGLSVFTKPVRREKALTELRRVGMESAADKFPHELSGGQQQRVALARALAPNPRIILLDEPYSGLDSALRAQVRDDVLHLLKESGAATLMVTHDPEEAMFMADRIAVMRDGRIVQEGSPHSLYCYPNSAFVAGIFGEVNAFTGPVKDGHVATPSGPAAVEDMVTAWKALLAGGLDPAKAAFGGDSAGGGLVLAALMSARDQGLPLPAAVGRAQAYVVAAIKGAPGFGAGHGPIDNGHTVRPFTAG